VLRFMVRLRIDRGGSLAGARDERGGTNVVHSCMWVRESKSTRCRAADMASGGP